MHSTCKFSIVGATAGAISVKFGVFDSKAGHATKLLPAMHGEKTLLLVETSCCQHVIIVIILI